MSWLDIGMWAIGAAVAVVAAIAGAMVLWAIYSTHEWLGRSARDWGEDEHTDGLNAPWNRRKK